MESVFRGGQIFGFESPDPAGGDGIYPKGAWDRDPIPPRPSYARQRLRAEAQGRGRLSLQGHLRAGQREPGAGELPGLPGRAGGGAVQREGRVCARGSREVLASAPVGLLPRERVPSGCARHVRPGAGPARRPPEQHPHLGQSGRLARRERAGPPCRPSLQSRPSSVQGRGRSQQKHGRHTRVRAGPQGTGRGNAAELHRDKG
mmetsp:Transcript_29033/g.77275  ORF Transcript_29033/g.77275 Transcript_29033/m.77275 type:complete len:203 (-) Transcript_29033:89-697(-)